MHTDPVLQNLNITLDLRTLPSAESWYRKRRSADQVTPRQDRAYSQELHAEGPSHRASAQRGRLALANSLRRLIRQDRQLHSTVTVRKIPGGSDPLLARRLQRYRPQSQSRLGGMHLGRLHLHPPIKCGRRGRDHQQGRL